MVRIQARVNSAIKVKMALLHPNAANTCDRTANIFTGQGAMRIAPS